MSPREQTFIKRLWIALLGVCGPFIIIGALNLIIMVPQVKANTESIDGLDEQYISRDVMVQYMENQRSAYDALVKGYDDTRTLNIEEHQIINARMDELMKQVYKNTTRGIK